MLTIQKAGFAVLAALAVLVTSIIFLSPQPIYLTGAGATHFINCSGTGQTLSSAGDVYILNDTCQVNVTALNIGADNITVDCAGFSIIGNDTIGTYGIEAVYRKNITVKNCNITHYQFGVIFDSTSSSLINNTYADGYYSTTPCDEIYDPETCDTVSGCSGEYTDGSCSGTPSGNPCWGLDEKVCELSESCVWNSAHDLTCAYCAVKESSCTRSDGSERSCNRDIACRYDRDCNACIDGGGISTPCEENFDQESCLADGCDWTEGYFTCTGDSSCANQLSCSAFYLNMGENLTMRNTSATGANGLVASNTFNLNSDVSNYYNDHMCIYQWIAQGSTFTRQNLSSGYIGFHNAYYGYNLTIDNSTIGLHPSGFNDYAVEVYGGNNFRLTNSVINGSAGTALNIMSQSNSTLENLTMNANTAYVIYAYDVHDNILKNLKLTSITGMALLWFLSDNSTMSNINAISTLAGRPVMLQLSDDNNLSNIRIASNGTGGYDALSFSQSYNNIMSSMSVWANTSNSLYMYSSANNTFTDINFTSAQARGAYIYDSRNNVFTRVNLIGSYFGTATTYLYSNSNNNTFADGLISGGGAYRAIYIEIYNYNNTFRNNTITNATIDLVAVSSQSTGNTFCLNNFTDVGSPGKYINAYSNVSLNCTPFSCYQETANVSNSCGGLGTGNYLFGNYEDEYNGLYAHFFVNYTKPSWASNSSIWRVRHGLLPSYDISLPASCFNQAPLQLRILSTWEVIKQTQPQCFNGTDWMNIGNNSSYDSGTGTQECGIEENTTNLVDGDWNTSANWVPGIVGLCGNVWADENPSEDTNYSKIYEEAMVWVSKNQGNIH